MSRIPHLPLYVDDYEGATAHLTLAEDGAYNRLIRLSWRTPGCSIPADHEWIKRRMRATKEEMEEIVIPILKEFFSVKRGRYIQSRLHAEFGKVNRKIKARKNAGKLGASAKAMKNKENASSKGKDLPYRLLKQPEPEPEPVISVPSGTGEPPPDDGKLAWSEGKVLLAEHMTVQQAGGFLGKLKSQHKLDNSQLLKIVRAAVKAGTGDPKSYLVKAARAQNGPTDADVWEGRVEGHQKRGFWLEDWGPKPGEPGCCVPDSQIERQYAQ